MLKDLNKLFERDYLNEIFKKSLKEDFIKELFKEKHAEPAFQTAVHNILDEPIGYHELCCPRDKL